MDRTMVLSDVLFNELPLKEILRFVVSSSDVYVEAYVDIDGIHVFIFDKISPISILGAKEYITLEEVIKVIMGGRLI